MTTFVTVTKIALTLSNLGKNQYERYLEFFFFIFSEKIGFDISSKLSPDKTICMK